MFGKWISQSDCQTSAMPTGQRMELLSCDSHTHVVLCKVMCFGSKVMSQKVARLSFKQALGTSMYMIKSLNKARQHNTTN